MNIRKSTMADLPEIMALYASARRFMAQNGNPGQWGNVHPPRQLIQKDMNEAKSYLCEEGGAIVGVFYFAREDDPTYRVIEQGDWLNGAPYGVVHRITARQGTHGVASFCLNWCFEQCGNLRIDTHEHNVPMRKALEKNGFCFCGKIYLEDGAERLAYQRTE